MNMQKMFILIGIIFILLGIFGSVFGKLPGDFSFKKGNMSFHFPFMTSLIVSVILSIAFYLFSQFK